MRVLRINGSTPTLPAAASGDAGDAAGVDAACPVVALEGRGGDALLLEQSADTVEPPRVAYVECKPGRCRCWFCASCCLVAGLRLRRRLIEALASFRSLQMWTFTVDPTLFASPAEAWAYLTAQRCLSRTLHELKRKGYLHSGRWFAVVEWHQTGWPHLHVLVDASFIPHAAVLAAWGRHRPEAAGPVQGRRPAFGTVLFSMPKFASRVHAARYATKYLTKVPEQGFPDWVLDSETRVRRFSTSRGFWGDADPAKRRPGDERAEERLKRLPCYRRRVRQCGEGVEVVIAREAVNVHTGEVVVNRRFIGHVCAPAGVLDSVTAYRRPGGAVLLPTADVEAALEVLEMAAGEPLRWAWRRYGLDLERWRPPIGCAWLDE